MSDVEMSHEIGDLAGALAKAQMEIPKVEKTQEAVVRSQKGTYTYRYATLGDCIEAIRKPLSENGLAIAQFTQGHEFVTLLMHDSGQWIRAACPMGEYASEQALGSAITYLRRYGLSLIGVVPVEDDDAQVAGEDSRENIAGQALDRMAGKRKAELGSCPACGNVESLIKGQEQYGGGFVCWKKKGGCGETWGQLEELRAHQQRGLPVGESDQGEGTQDPGPPGGVELATEEELAFLREELTRFGFKTLADIQPVLRASLGEDAPNPKDKEGNVHLSSVTPEDVTKIANHLAELEKAGHF